DRENLAIAVSLVPGACMSEPVLVDEHIPPDAQGGWSILESRLSCTAENATALLATGFAVDDEAARRIQQHQIPAATVNGLREEIGRLNADYHKQWRDWMGEQHEQNREPPVPPWQNKG